MSGPERAFSVMDLFEAMGFGAELIKQQTGHVGNRHFGWSYAHRRGPHGYPTDDADIRCGCGEILTSFVDGEVTPWTEK